MSGLVEYDKCQVCDKDIKQAWQLVNYELMHFVCDDKCKKKYTLPIDNPQNALDKQE